MPLMILNNASPPLLHLPMSVTLQSFINSSNSTATSFYYMVVIGVPSLTLLDLLVKWHVITDQVHSTMRLLSSVLNAIAQCNASINDTKFNFYGECIVCTFASNEQWRLRGKLIWWGFDLRWMYGFCFYTESMHDVLLLTDHCQLWH